MRQRNSHGGNSSDRCEQPPFDLAYDRKPTAIGKIHQCLNFAFEIILDNNWLMTSTDGLE